MATRAFITVVLLALGAVVPNVRAQETETVEELLEEGGRIPRVRRWIADQELLQYLQPYVDFKQWLADEVRLEVATQNVTLYQRSTGGRRPRETAINNFTWFGRWMPFDPDEVPGMFVFSFERRDTLSNATVREFSAEVGASYQTNDFSIRTRDRTALRQLWWKQPLLDGRLVLSLGKLNPSTFYDRNRFAGSSSTGFVSQPFATNPTRRFPGDGLGLNLTFTVNDAVELTGGVQDANGNNKRSGFNTIGEGELFAAAGIRFTPVFDGLGEGNYRFLLWHTDATSRSNDGFGFLASFDQDLDERVGAFLRYGYSEREVGRLEHMVSGGLVFSDPFGLDHGDVAGVGVSWTRPNRADDGDLSTELYYKVQLTANMQVTPSMLVVFDPENSDAADPVAVFGIRLRVLF
jgi:porin